MSQVSIYLNFPRNTEEVFIFYKGVFGTEFEEGRMMRFSEIPPSDDMPPMPETKTL